MSPTGIGIVGAGLTGLAAAWELTGGRPAGAEEFDVTVFEAATGPGGKVAASSVDGLLLDEGADSFLIRTPQATTLCAEIGIVDLIHPSGAPAFVWIDDRLVPLPGGLVLGAPARFDDLEAAGILSDDGLARAREQPTISMEADDVGVGELITRHYGTEVTDRLVAPLVGGISAGAVDRLSAASITPQLFAAARSGEPMAAALRSQSPAPGPVFAAPRDGMSQLVDRLVAELAARGVDFRWNTPVGSLDERDDGAWVVTAPAHVASTLVEPRSPDAAAGLAAIDVASVVFVTLVFDRGDVDHPLAGSGFLVPRSAGLRVTAASWMTSKWTQLVPDGRVVIRAALGHIDDSEPIGWEDARILDTVMGDLTLTMGRLGAPRAHRVVRYPAAFPQYEVGHAARVRAISAALDIDCPRVEVCGMAHQGVGIPACIGSGRAAAARLRARLSS